MRGNRGLTPIVATVILIGLTVAAAVPLAVYFSAMYSPAKPRRTDIEIYAGLVNENTIRFHILHVGGTTIYDPLSTDPDEGIRGMARGPGGVDNQMYCWTFENPEKFRQADFGYAEVQLHGANLRVGSSIWVNIWKAAGGGIWEGDVIVDDLGMIPG